MLQRVPETQGLNHATTSWPHEDHAPADPLDQLARLGTRIAVRRGRRIFGEGSAAKACFRLTQGSARLVKLMADGHRQVCAFLKAGDLLGFETEDEYFFSAEAVSDCVLARYPRRAVETLLADDKAFARRVRELTARGLQDAYRRMVLLCRKSARARVAWFLLDLADAETNDFVRLPMTRTDIASYLGMAIETVSRVLGQFRRSGAIAQKNLGTLQILDRAALLAVRGPV
jgi:CRP-like cAMP-binding protein